MFVETMTSQQMADQYEKDYDQVIVRLSYDFKKWLRASYKIKQFPYCFAKSGTTKQGNLFKAVIRILKGSRFKIRILFRMKTSNGDAWIEGTGTKKGKKILGLNEDFEPFIYLYNPHLLRRYEERFGRMSGYASISDQFFIRNELIISADIDGSERYGQYDTRGIVNDGIIFGTKPKDSILTWRTFLCIDQLNNKQTFEAKALAKLYNSNQNDDKNYDKTV